MAKAMPRISPARPCSEPGPAIRACYGFTIIEVVIALALCALVAGVVASSLGVALGAERQAVRLREQRRAADTLQHVLLLPVPTEELLAPLREDWETTPAPQTTGEATNQQRWTVWELSRSGEASRRSFIALRAPGGEAE